MSHRDKNPVLPESARYFWAHRLFSDRRQDRRLLFTSLVVNGSSVAETDMFSGTSDQHPSGYDLGPKPGDKPLQGGDGGHGQDGCRGGDNKDHGVKGKGMSDIDLDLALDQDKDRDRHDRGCDQDCDRNQDRHDDRDRNRHDDRDRGRDRDHDKDRHSPGRCSGERKRSGSRERKRSGSGDRKHGHGHGHGHGRGRGRGRGGHC
ncbi:negative elongation factor E-like [Xiphophorus couchianus]|uniref:negative elongation factor E-like n=1 Tax=Xiphophorus couchianus TaxID=32473 RepID=UPI001015CD97|nr:negative elongation factor E-like [Xiphophorus couchianus]